MIDWIIAIILVIVFGISITYMIKEKKKGVRCIGCPSSGTCASRGKCSGSCHTIKF